MEIKGVGGEKDSNEVGASDFDGVARGGKMKVKTGVVRNCVGATLRGG